MKTASAKSKGRRATQETREAILKRFPELEPDDIIVTPSGVTGEDLRLSPKARSLFPFCIEVKNQEKLNIWSAFEQAKTHGGHKPLLVFRRNRSKLMVCLELEDFLECVK
jgi:hypothetical protein